ncbi:MAG: SprT-like domain-containing protein [Candidatus Limivicinus sp.]
MHTLEEIRAEYDRLDRRCGVDTSGVEIVLSRRGVRRLGSFRYPAKGKRGALRITINASLLNEEEQFWDTVRHEYAHALVYLRSGGVNHGHDRVWKAACREVGCSEDRLAAQTAESREEMERRAKYKVCCTGCGQESLYFRRGKVVELLLRGGKGQVRCGKCGSNRLKLYVREGS